MDQNTNISETTLREIAANVRTIRNWVNFWGVLAVITGILSVVLAITNFI